MTRPRQFGFTLVEIMVALLIASLMMSALLSLLSHQRAGLATQQAQAQLQENARLAEFMLSYLLAHAGYRNEGPLPVAVSDAQANHGGNHALKIHLEAHGEIMGCLGENITGKTAFQLFINARGALSCRRFAARETTTQPLVEHIERFKLQYGLDTTGDGSVDRLVNTLSAATQSQLRSIRFQLLLRSAADVSSRPLSRHYRFSDGSVLAVRDRKARLLLDRTVSLHRAVP